MSDECCSRMEHDLHQQCDEHPDRFDCPDSLITKNKSGYGLIVHDGGHSYIKISYCPWCGTKIENHQ